MAGAAQAQDYCHDVEHVKLTADQRAALARVMVQQSPTPDAEAHEKDALVLKVFIAPNAVRSHGWTVLRASQSFYDPKTGEQYDATDQVPFFFSGDPLKTHYVGYLDSDSVYGFDELQVLMEGLPNELALCYSDPNA